MATTQYPASPVQLCGLAAEAVRGGRAQEALELYAQAMRAGDPEWGPFAAVVLGNLLAEAGECAAAEYALRTAIASDHPIWAVSAAHHLAGLDARLRESAETPDTDESGDDPAWSSYCAPPDRHLAVERHRRRRAALAAGAALAAVLCASAAGVAVGLHAEEVADRAAVRGRSHALAGEVTAAGAASYEIRYSRQGRPVELRVGRHWPDGKDRDFAVGAAVALLDDPLDGIAEPFVAADLDHADPWFEPGVIGLLLSVAGVLGCAAVVEGRRCREPRPAVLPGGASWSSPGMHGAAGHGEPPGLTMGHRSRPSPHISAPEEGRLP